MNKNKIAIGTVQFGLNYGISNEYGKTSYDEISKILTFCIKNNIHTLDTAYSYGESESMLGKFEIKNFEVISKFLINKSNPQSIRLQLESSLKKLNLDNLYGYLAHRPLDITNYEWSELNKLKIEGKVKKIGFSFNEPEEIDEILNKGFIPDLIQAPYNYLDTRFEKKIDFLKTNYNTEIHTRSVFLQGLFFMNPYELPKFFNPIIKDLEYVYSKKHKAGSLLKFVINNKNIDKVIIGVNNLNQLENNLLEIPDSEYLKRNYERSFPLNCIIPSKWEI